MAHIQDRQSFMFSSSRVQGPEHEYLTVACSDGRLSLACDLHQTVASGKINVEGFGPPIITVLGEWLPRYCRSKRTDKGNSVYTFFCFLFLHFHSFIVLCLALSLHILELSMHVHNIRGYLSSLRIGKLRN